MEHKEIDARGDFSDRIWDAISDATHSGLDANDIGGTLLAIFLIINQKNSGHIHTANLLRDLSDKVLAEARGA